MVWTWLGGGVRTVLQIESDGLEMVWKWFVGALRAALRMESAGLEVRGQAEVRGRLLARPSEEGGVTNHTLAMHGLCTDYAQAMHSELHTATHKRPSHRSTNTRRLWEAGPT